MTKPTGAPMPSAVVAIPVYRPAPDAREARALLQLGRVLARHPLVLVIPETLDPAPYQRLLPALRVESFAPGFFTSVQAYNRLMLADEFYARFAAWDFVLIHQLDAWVFADRLDDWCRRGYDYVGAPWLKPWHLRRGFRGVYREARHRLARWLPLDPTGRWARYRINGLAGNGGLSLRRVDAFRTALAKAPVALARFHQGGVNPFLNEDVFWAGWAGLRVPPWRESLDFAIEHEVPRALARLGHLPFGCHAWPLLADDWRAVPAARGMFEDATLVQGAACPGGTPASSGG